MVRAMACMCPSTAVVVSKNHLYWARLLIRRRRPPCLASASGAFRNMPRWSSTTDARAGAELLDEVVGGHLRLERLAAGEDVHGGVPVLGPGVDREVGLGDDDHAADPERVELVKDDVDDGRLSPLGGLDHRALHGLKAVDGLRVAVEQLEQQVTPQSLHLSPPLASRLSSLFTSLCPKNFGQRFFNVGPAKVHCKKKMSFFASVGAVRA